MWKSTAKSKGNNKIINELHQSRTCYDHLAGVEGVYLLEKMLDLKWLIIDNAEKPTYRLSAEGEDQLSVRGVRIPIRKNSRRMFAYGCLDWTVRSPHLGGALGASILRTLEESGFLQKVGNSRKIRMKKDLSFFFDPVQKAGY